MSNQDELTYTVAELAEELRSEEIDVRLAALRKLPSLSRRFGPSKTRAEILPLLFEAAEDDEEVCEELSGQLLEWQECLGGDDASAQLLPLALKLLAPEEPLPREKALDSLISLLRRLLATKPSLALSLAEEAQRLLLSSPTTSGRAACAFILPILAQASRLTGRSAKQAEGRFDELGGEGCAVVRRAVAANVATSCSLGRNASSLLPLLLHFSTDTVDAVRVHVLDGALSLWPDVGEEERKELVRLVRQAAADSKWRVRQAVASRFARLLDAAFDLLPGEEKSLVAAYVKLLEDLDESVRFVAASSLPSVLPLLRGRRSGVLAELRRALLRLGDDLSARVRAAVAALLAAPVAAEVLLRGDLVDDANVLVYLSLLQRSSSDEGVLVRLRAVEGLEVAFGQVPLSSKYAGQLLTLASEVQKDKHWRVRLAAVGLLHVLSLIGKANGVSGFSQMVARVVLTWLSDSVYALRQAAARALRTFIELYGAEWSQQFILPRVLLLYSHPNHLHRITTLEALQVMGEAVGGELVTSSVLPLVLRMASDNVPNVRLNVARTLQRLLPLVEPEVSDQRIKPALHALSEDPDPDVRVIASFS